MKILLAVDDSRFAAEAIRTLVAQVRTQGTEIRVLHVIEEMHAYLSAEMVPHLVPHIAEIEAERQKQGKALVHEGAQKLRKAGFQVSEAVETGDPKARIVDQAAKWRADLIVVGSHGWKGLNRFLMGSVSEAVARHAACSVQIIRPRGAAGRRRSGKSQR
ncbi:MAG: universal stress protein [Acidobacteriia bacterium]|nr:universal stress protein [Terriglobia bacterium]